ncbi:hypothetical protein CIB95_13635 [Lottiidibacillus patelloidae]|uniref:Antirepressor AbbA n=1 Tax=Lottiidibacillus patelloidae TaxID=2670334 RepID=A0A263BR29_9BACI|nr:antirepressor AbbA [Lottiidibacillus patelloidae]OZM56144.1 hypothetical protein CIB95_13635 [Lottiidibacillus patelloidae]
MEKTKNDLLLSETEKDLLLEVLISQNYVKELVSCEITDIECGVKKTEEARIKKLNDLFDRIVDAGL